MFVKLYSRITESSLMEQPIEVRYTFLMLLAIADPTGLVVGTDIAISRRLNIPIDSFVNSVKILGEPDPDSNSKEEEGRRVVASDSERGYQLVNFLKYRNLKDEDSKREYMREYMQKKRASEANVKLCKGLLKNVVNVTQAEAEAEVEAETTSTSDSNPKIQEPKAEDPASKIIEHLNQLTGKTYRTNTIPYLKSIKGRLSEVSNDVPGVLTMVARQVALWKNTDMEKYLNPDTLFRASKFPKYYDERNLPLPKIHSPVSVAQANRAAVGGDVEAHAKLRAEKSQRIQAELAKQYDLSYSQNTVAT